MSEEGHRYKFGSDANYRNAWEEFERRRKERISAAGSQPAEVQDALQEQKTNGLPENKPP